MCPGNRKVVLEMLETLEGVRCLLGPVKDVRLVPKVLDVVLWMLEVMDGVRSVLW